MEIKENPNKNSFILFVENNRMVFQNKIIASFFRCNTNVGLLHAMLNRRDASARKELETRFKKHFFQYRFSKYIYSTIRFGSIALDRKRSSYFKRNLLILDMPEDDRSKDDSGLRSCMRETFEVDNDPYNFQNYIEREWLYYAYSQLTKKQQKVIMLAYSFCLVDREIAARMRISQQAVCKIRNSALRRLRSRLTSMPMEVERNKV
ncbi:sigma-70 family RNA polymerase sigma factor [Xylanibacillus composti]|uniref:RNA polymerase sigma-70 region 4 domain-containing protein n=1 Tax=Xylanibacillus composti TaxID=1572762 RepID=A0A8J4H648_9BACL|nr:sigma factor-like helix-turn-helix DNA-binding protein [Xylanibacillus composti]MDT9725420.1 sigma-70 family RNA polymerase sigma factor [Xylanibacillus composti]GIQ71549.1 hypothetical protein XYCOK13_43730 [Xylanibacillus composti]